MFLYWLSFLLPLLGASGASSVLSLLSDTVGAAMKITSEPAEVMVLCQRAEVWQQVTRTRAALKP